MAVGGEIVIGLIERRGRQRGGRGFRAARGGRALSAEGVRLRLRLLRQLLRLVLVLVLVLLQHIVGRRCGGGGGITSRWSYPRGGGAATRDPGRGAQAAAAARAARRPCR